MVMVALLIIKKIEKLNRIKILKRVPTYKQ